MNRILQNMRAVQFQDAVRIAPNRHASTSARYAGNAAVMGEGNAVIRIRCAICVSRS
jgi:hypothetical protein